MLNHQDLMARGLAKLNEIDGEQGDKVRQALADISPDLGKYIIGFAFGEIYQRPQLDVRQRGCENQLRVHIHASLNVGLTRDEIVEAFIQCIPYLGFPKVLNAVFVAKEVFAAAE